VKPGIRAGSETRRRAISLPLPPLSLFLHLVSRLSASHYLSSSISQRHSHPSHCATLLSPRLDVKCLSSSSGRGSLALSCALVSIDYLTFLLFPALFLRLPAQLPHSSFFFHCLARALIKFPFHSACFHPNSSPSPASAAVACSSLPAPLPSLFDTHPPAHPTGHRAVGRCARDT
jgi:hypothetical protein